MNGRKSGRRVAARAKVPATAAVEPRCEGLLIGVGRHAADDAEALRLAKAVVRRHLGAGWRVAPLGQGARDFLARPSGDRLMPVSQAWEKVEELRRDRDVFDAEPALVGPGLEPATTAPGRQLTAREAPLAAAAAVGGDQPLPCSARFDWSLALCNVQQAWALQPPAGGKRRGEGIVVGHPDTGFTRHAEIFSADPAKNRLLFAEGRNFFEGGNDPLDTLSGKNPGHGTGTASVIMSDAPQASPAPLASTVFGVAPLARLVPLRVTDTVVLFSFSALAEAIYFAAEKGFHVISISLGGPIRSRTLQRAIRHAIDHGVVVLAAAGNVWPFVVYPARFEEVVAVAACNCQRRVWRSSASGGDVDVTAPGESVWVARAGDSPGPADDRVARSSGTSHAVATTAGACALWLAFHGRRKLIDRYGAKRIAAVFKEVLMSKGVTVPAGWDKSRHGAGILDVKKLLQAPLPATPPAAGMGLRAAAPALAAAPPGPLDEFLPYFPGKSRPQVRRGLVKFLKTTEADLPETLVRVGDELLFHVATNPEVRATIAGEAPARRAAGRRVGVAAPAAPATPAAEPRFRRTASPALRAMTGGGG